MVRADLACLLTLAGPCVTGRRRVRQSLPELTAGQRLRQRHRRRDGGELEPRIRALQTQDRRHGRRRDGRDHRAFGSIEEYAVKLFERRGIGEREQDNGALVLVAVRRPEDVGSRSATASKSSSPTATPARRFARRCCRPFARARYGAGLLAGTTRLIQRIAERRGVTLTDVPAPRRPSTGARASASATDGLHCAHHPASIVEQHPTPEPSRPPGRAADPPGAAGTAASAVRRRFRRLWWRSAASAADSAEAAAAAVASADSAAA